MRWHSIIQDTSNLNKGYSENFYQHTFPFHFNLLYNMMWMMFVLLFIAACMSVTKLLSWQSAGTKSSVYILFPCILVNPLYSRAWMMFVLLFIAAYMSVAESSQQSVGFLSLVYFLSLAFFYLRQPTLQHDVNDVYVVVHCCIHECLQIIITAISWY